MRLVTPIDPINGARELAEQKSQPLVIVLFIIIASLFPYKIVHLHFQFQVLVKSINILVPTLKF